MEQICIPLMQLYSWQSDLVVARTPFPDDDTLCHLLFTLANLICPLPVAHPASIQP